MKKTILSIVLIAVGITCSYAASIEDITKDALINNTNNTLTGTFGAYDFDPKGDNDAFDWAFTLASGQSYQLQGIPPSDADAFGWKPVDIIAPKPLWYMFPLDIDADGTKEKFEWVLLSTNIDNKAVYKLEGEKDGSFVYSDKIDIDYEIVGNNITTGAVDTLNTIIETEKPEVSTPNNSNLKVTHIDDLKGHTISSNKSSIGESISISIKCDGSFEYIASNGSYTNSGSGAKIYLDDEFAYTEYLWWEGIYNNGDAVGEFFTDSLSLDTDKQIIIDSTCWSDFGSGQTVGNCSDGLYVKSIFKDTTCN